MFTKSRTAYGKKLIRKRFLQKFLFAAVALALFVLISVIYINLKGRGRNESKELRAFYDVGDFESSFSLSGKMLDETPLDFLLLTIHGFSAYQCAIAQINSSDTLSYLDECIWTLRKALLLREDSPQVSYVLGKAYYNKGQGYADLAVKYLEKARDALYMAADIPEYLGLSYAAVRDYRSSVEAFTMALSGENQPNSSNAYGPAVNPSDVLLLAIARSYLALEENESSRAYLVRCIETSKDSKTITTARLLLAGILTKEGNFSGAEKEYQKILEENSENAEAHYQLGELYATAGNTTRARAEWRRTLRISPAHGPARSRLNL